MSRKFKPVTNIYNTYDDWGDTRYLPIPFRNTINIYQPRKKLYHRETNPSKKQRQEYSKQDDEMISGFRYGSEDKSIYLIELIDNYTPLIKTMADNPYKYIDKIVFKAKSKAIEKFRRGEDITGYHYLSSLADDIMEEVLVSFIELVKDYNFAKGSFSGYIKSYLPYKLIKVFNNAIYDLKNEYIDGIDEAFEEEFQLKHLSCSIEYEEEQGIDLGRYNLTKPQEAVAKLLSEGLNISQIAKELKISRTGVNNHIKLIRKKFLKFIA